MKKLFFAAVAIFILNISCFASQPTEKLYERFRVGELVNDLPYQAEEAVETIFDGGITLEKVVSLTPRQLIQIVKRNFSQSVTENKGQLISIMTAVLFSAILSLISESGKCTEIFDLICVLSITAVLLRPILDCIQLSCDTIRELSRFMLLYIPIYTSIIASSGAVGGAAAYQTAVMAAAQVLSQLSDKLFLPMMQGYLLVSLSGVIGKNKGVVSVASGLKKLINWGLVFTATVFTGILSIQSLITSATDSAAAKTAKFLAGSFVPIIGGAFSDALSAIHGSMRIIKASVGGFGIAAAVLTFMPALIRITVLRAILWFANTAGEVVSAERSSGIFSGFSNVLSAMTALLLVAAMIFIISTAIMINSVITI